MIEAYSWLSHDASPEDLQIGDHIYKWSSMFHTSHGLVYKITEAADSQADLLDRIIVLHLVIDEDSSAAAEIRCSPLRSFMASGDKGVECGVKRARYDVSKAELMMKLPGTCYPFEASSIVDVLRRSEALLQASESHPYHLRSLNQETCEHIIVWCKTGQWRAPQVENIVALARGVAFVLAGMAACRGANPGAASKGPSLLAPLIGGALLWKATQQDLEETKPAERADLPPPFVSKADTTGKATRLGFAENSNDNAQAQSTSCKGVEHTEEDDFADYVMIEDMRASKEFIVVPAARQIAQAV